MILRFVPSVSLFLSPFLSLSPPCLVCISSNPLTVVISITLSHAQRHHSFLLPLFTSLSYHVSFIYFPSLPTKSYSLSVRTSPAASLPTTSTDVGSLSSLSSSHTDIVTAASPPIRHSSLSSHHSDSQTHSLSYDHSLSFANSPTHPFLSTPAPSPPTGLTSPHDTPYSHPPSSQAHKSLTVIIFAFIGGTVALLFLALFARRAIAHIRLPRHTAVLTVAERAQLAREIAEYTESATRRQRHSLTGPPPPPYEHAPSYDSHRSS